MNKRGKEVTPWLLARVAELTKGDSMSSNLALLRNTASVGECFFFLDDINLSLPLGSQIAVQYAKLANGYDVWFALVQIGFKYLTLGILGPSEYHFVYSTIC